MDPLELMIFAPARCIICTGDHAAIADAATLAKLEANLGITNGAQMLTFAMAKEGHPQEVSGTIISFVNMI